MKQKTWLRLLGELRRRLLLILVIALAGAVFCYIFIDQIRNILLLPTFTPDIFSFFKLFLQQYPWSGLPADLAPPVNLIFLTPGEAFMANLRLAIVCGVLLTLPLLLYQVVAAAMVLQKKRARGAVFLTAIIWLLFLLGLSFAYFVVFPFAMNFFLGFATAEIGAEWSIARYLSFATSFLFAFGLVFQIPLVFWFLGAIGVLNAAFLRRHRKYAVVIILVLAAILTPPDVFSQIMMAIPLLLLFECGILLVAFAGRRRARAAAAANKADV